MPEQEIVLIEAKEKEQSSEKEAAPEPDKAPSIVMKRARRAWWHIPVVVLIIVLSSTGISGADAWRGQMMGFFLLPMPVGPYIEGPLSAQQIDAIHHLSEHLRDKQLASLYVARMSLDEIIGQLIMPQYAEEDYSSDLEYMITQQHVGGVIMYSNANQLRTKEQVQHDTSQMQAHAQLPLLIAIDEEGWNVDRLGQIYSGRRPSAADIHNSGSTTFAREQGEQVAEDMLALGINTNLAPDVDVALKDMYIDYDYRGFGSTPDEVIKYAGPYLEGMQQAGVIGTLKHYPGIGSISYADDPHSTLPVVEHSKDEVYNSDLVPFKHFIQSRNVLDQPGMIMTTYVMVPSIDTKYPAQYSHVLISDILRKQLGYDGVVITDSLIMGGSQLDGQSLDVGQGAVLALQAGDDLLLGPDGSAEVDLVVKDVKAALQDGRLTLDQLKESATRIVALKMERWLMAAEAPL